MEKEIVLCDTNVVIEMYKENLQIIEELNNNIGQDNILYRLLIKRTIKA